MLLRFLKGPLWGLVDAEDFLNFCVIDSRPAKMMSSIEIRFSAIIWLMLSGDGSSELRLEMWDDVDDH
jgi:hypothetical protein